MLNVAHRLRKLRNRLSQRAFRLRQAKKINQLHYRVEVSQSHDIDRERFLALQQENERLRKHIELLQAQTDDVLASLKAMSLSSSRLLESGNSLGDHSIHVSSNTCTHGQDSEPSAPPQPATNVTREERGNLVAESDDADEVVGFQGNVIGPSRPCHEPAVTGSTSTDQYGDWPPLFTSGDLSLLENTQTKTPTATYPHEQDSENIHLNPNFFDHDLILEDLSNFDCAELQSIPPGIPNVWNFDYQMGSDSYANAIASIRPSAARTGWVESNSPISDHIRILKSFLSVKFKPSDVSLSVCRT
jgi:hypothetical protein